MSRGLLRQPRGGWGEPHRVGPVRVSIADSRGQQGVGRKDMWTWEPGGLSRRACLAEGGGGRRRGPPSATCSFCRLCTVAGKATTFPAWRWAYRGEEDLSGHVREGELGSQKGQMCTGPVGHLE